MVYPGGTRRSLPGAAGIVKITIEKPSIFLKNMKIWELVVDKTGTSDYPN